MCKGQAVSLNYHNMVKVLNTKSKPQRKKDKDQYYSCSYILNDIQVEITSPRPSKGLSEKRRKKD